VLRTLAVALILATPVAAQVRTATPEELARTGESALAAGRYREAFEAFAAAAHARPREITWYVGAAQAAAMFGRLADAQSWLERALQISPGHGPASLVLGQVFYRQGRLDAALAAVEAGLARSPGDQKLTTQAEAWRAEARAQADLRESRSAHVTVLFEGLTDHAVARAVIGIAEPAYERIGRVLLTFPREPVRVVLYTGQQFRDLTRAQPWVAGAFDGRIKLPTAGALERPDELRRVVEHEMVHAMVMAAAGAAGPVWLHEGLATMLEPGGELWAQEVLARTPTRLKLTQLSSGFAGAAVEVAALAYAQSTIAVRQLRDRAGMPGIVGLLRSLEQGVPFETAFRRAAAVSLEEFEARLRW